MEALTRLKQVIINQSIFPSATCCCGGFSVTFYFQMLCVIRGDERSGTYILIAASGNCLSPINLVSALLWPLIPSSSQLLCDSRQNGAKSWWGRCPQSLPPILPPGVAFAEAGLASRLAPLQSSSPRGQSWSLPSLSPSPPSSRWPKQALPIPWPWAEAARLRVTQWINGRAGTWAPVSQMQGKGACKCLVSPLFTFCYVMPNRLKSWQSST